MRQHCTFIAMGHVKTRILDINFSDHYWQEYIRSMQVPVMDPGFLKGEATPIPIIFEQNYQPHRSVFEQLSSSFLRSAAERGFHLQKITATNKALVFKWDFHGNLSGSATAHIVVVQTSLSRLDIADHPCIWAWISLKGTML